MPDANIEIKELMDQAQRLMRQGAFAEAEELFQTLLANAPTAPDEMVALEGLALIALEKDDAAKAIELFEKVMASTPERADLHYNLANAYAATGRFDLAVEAYQG
ncbi:MAG: tetratricopeptide repeat protein, partial [Proteobacteria bacterium]|nr:tetratricopeptide repeat protein [Pseudomonadota bacterium]